MKAPGTNKSIGELAANFISETVAKGKESAEAGLKRYIKGITRSQLEEYVIKMMLPTSYYIAMMQKKDKVK